MRLLAIFASLALFASLSQYAIARRRQQALTRNSKFLARGRSTRLWPLLRSTQTLYSHRY